MRAVRRLVGGCALGAMIVLWWWAFAELGTSRLVAPEVPHDEYRVLSRAPFGRAIDGITLDNGAVVGRQHSNQTFLAGWGVLLGTQALLAMVAARALGLRAFARPRFGGPTNA